MVLSACTSRNGQFRRCIHMAIVIGVMELQNVDIGHVLNGRIHAMHPVNAFRVLEGLGSTEASFSPML
jgi:hypothetical protein